MAKDSIFDQIAEYDRRKDKARRDKSKSSNSARERHIRTFMNPGSADATDRRRGGVPMERSKIGGEKKGTKKGGPSFMDAIKGALGATSDGLFGGLAAAVQQQTAQREAMLQMQMQQQQMEMQGPAAIEAAMLAMPDKAGYLRPYEEAEGAARTAYDASKAVIGSSTQELKGDLSRNQQDYLAMQAQHGQQLDQDASAMAGQMTQDLAPSGLAKALGVDGGIAAEAALLQAQANQQAGAQRNLFNRMGEVQGQDYDARVKGADGAEAAAQMAAAQNLSSILQQLAGGKADATRQFEEDSNQVRQANAESERRAREEYQRQVQEEQKAMQDWEKTNQAAMSKSQTTAFRQKEHTYMQRYPIATSAFQGLLQDAGDEPTRTNKQRALQLLPEMIEWARTERRVSLDPTVLRRWINEHYDQPTVDEERFLMNGGDPSYLSRR